MTISFNKALGTYEAALTARTERAQVLANNLANADTPGFKARDVDFQAALNRQLGNRPHAGSASSASLLYRTPTQPSIDGNTVDEHLEHAEYMANSLEFQVAFTLLNSRFKGLSRAINGE